MSGTYIGPFGRILPVPEDYDLPQSPKSPSLEMLARKMPPLPDMRLAFGSDPTPGFTDPNLYSRSQKPNTSSRTRVGRTLPGVSQLLSPVSPSTGDASFPSRFGTGSPSEPSSGYPSPRPDEHNAQSYSRSGGHTSHGQTPQGSHFQSPYGNLVREPLPQRMASRPYTASYPSNLDHQRPSWEPSLPTPSSTPSSALFQWPMAQRPEYRPAAPPPAQASRGTASTIPPVLKVVGEETIPGEGPCHLYADGSHVKKYIDGEVVNPQWGITKAGKPRKRLAQACMTCREKKIKCDPGDEKCIQCDKSGKDCHFHTP
jgi:hypothetical protein